ncbi:MAG: tetratricopeptide repeat protein [Myxococcales bacterium]|nr:tetratricopeptide repeat protein [Myxococcales bacterium]
MNTAPLAWRAWLLAALAGPAIALAQGSRGATSAGSPPQRAASSAPGGRAGMCVAPEARQAVEECPAGAAKLKRGRAQVPTTHLQTAKRRQQEKKQGPSGPSIELDEATRRNRERVEARAWDLLQREVQVLQRLVRNTRTNDPRRPDILLRLAETYFEMQQAVNARVRSFDQPIFEARQAKNAQKVRQLEQQQRQAEEQLNAIRQDAIRAYATLVQDHPDYRRMDEVLFSLAFSLEEMRQFDRARQVYHRLIKGFPQSRFVPHAYLSFAEYYFAEGQMREALTFYQKVVELPPERNPVYGFALYKMAWAAYNLEDFRASLERFVQVIEFAQNNPDAREAANLARQSRREMVLPYARVGTPNRALEFFRRFSQNEEQALEILESLGELYNDTGQWPNTIAVYQKLIAERPASPKVCYWQSRIANAIIASRPKPEQVREAQRLVDLWETWSREARHPAEALQQCKQVTASILVDLATAWHREAVGTDTQPGTNDRNTMNLAAQLYRLLIEKFPDMEQMQFPDIDRRDWPTAYRVSYFYAELLWKMEDWAQCGPAFDRVVELNPDGEYTADAAYAAVLCYNNLYQQQYQAREREVAHSQQSRRRGRRGQAQEEETQSDASRLAPRELTATERGMLAAFQRYVCYVPDGEDLPTIKYRRARIYYESNRFQEAAMLFRDIAWNHRDSELAVYAANLYLDSLNVLGTMIEPRRVECIGEMKEAIEPLFGFYCDTEEKRAQNSDLCGVLQQLRCDVLRKEAEAEQANGQYREAALTYVSIYRRYPECGRLDEVLYNAALNFEAARLVGRAIQVRRVLVDRFPESNLAKRAIYLLGANYHALAVYGQAAEYYERFARQFPGEDGSRCTDEERRAQTCAIAHEALQNAVFFRIGLGEFDKAIEDAQLFARNYQRRLPRETSQVVFSIGTIYRQQQNWTKLIDHYRGFLRNFARSALPHQVIRAHVEMGNAYLALDDRNRAQQAFRDASRAWGGAAERIAAAEGATDEQKALWLYEAKDATSEALFRLADYRYEEFRAIRFPQFRGTPSAQRIQQWSQNEFAQWVQAKQNAINTAMAEYNRIAELQIPRWEIAAAARIGEMFRSFVDEFRDAPVPEEIARDPELNDIYLGALDEASEPFLRQAIDKFEFCLITSTRVRWFNEFSSQCEQELFRLNPRDYPLAAELRAEPRYVFDTPGRPGVVELGASRAAADEEAEVEGGGGS